MVRTRLRVQEPSVAVPTFIHSLSFSLSVLPKFQVFLWLWGFMGSGFSALLKNNDESSSSSQNPGLGDLPEGCVALILTHLEPKEICGFARLNRAFRGASSADFVWESKLPTNYTSLIHQVFGIFPENLSKKEIYARLSRPRFLDGGSKRAWLDKCTGKICLSLSSNGLAITGIDDRRYWSHIPSEESRFRTIAYLQQIWWFEVGGEVEFLFPPGKYSLFFRLQLGLSSKRFGCRVCNHEHIHGWNVKPVRFQLWTSDDQYASSHCFLGDSGKWIHYHVGDFFVGKADAPIKIKFSMTQIDCTHTKGGLSVDSVLVYPSEFRERLRI